MEKVALYKTRNYTRNTLIENIVKIFDAFGGAGTFFKRGETVLVKPNLLFGRNFNSQVTTHPEVVYAACSILKDLGCKIIIGDSPGFGTAESVAAKCGIMKAANDIGARVVNFTKNFEVRIRQDGIECATGNIRPSPLLKLSDRIYKSFEIDRAVLEADKILNLAKLKSHGQMLLTMTVKNLFGCVGGILKPQWHFKAGDRPDVFARMLLELNLLINPDFTILDGIFGMEGNGPGNGTPRELNILAGGVNCVAIDAVAAGLIGVRPESFFTGRTAIKMGIPGARLEDIEVCGGKMADFNIKNFKLPNIMATDWPIFWFLKGALKSLMAPKPLYDAERCKFCKICQEVCPAGAVNVVQARGVDFDLKKCIRCFCCQEMCPYGAITVKKSVITKITSFFGR